MEDRVEEEVCRKFFQDGCGCSDNCHLKFEEDYLRTTRNDMAELSRAELDLVVMGQVMASTHCSDTTRGETWRKMPRERAHNYSSFSHRGEKVNIDDNLLHTNYGHI